MTARDTALAMQLLAAASQVVDGIHTRMVSRGYPDVRPAHGFAFVRISQGGATMLDVAEHLGVTKQAASQLVEQLVQRGYVTRGADADDARRKLLTLTPRGWACTRAAEAAAAETIASWRPTLGESGLAGLHKVLSRLELAGPIRPAW